MNSTKRVFIVKANEAVADILNNAGISFNESKRFFYNVSGADREFIRKECKNDDSGIILILSYSKDKCSLIEELYIGQCNIYQNWNIQYQMYRHLCREFDENAINCIVDKIDLDLNKDFATGRYMIISDMYSLYEELYQRITFKIGQNLLSTENNSEIKEESYQLSPLAQKNSQSYRIYREKKTEDDRAEFQRDRERIVNSQAFRRMVDKAQIFSANKGVYYRTRLTHTLEVNQIAKAIAYALNLNLDLTEAIALAHDLGHTPFGHQGERTLDDILNGRIRAGIVASDYIFDHQWFGGFKHNYQSARVLTQGESRYVDFPGLNISIQVIEGVLKHTNLKEDMEISDFINQAYIDKMNFNSDPATLEGQVVAVADEIAQRGHDVDDALTSGVMSIDEFMDRLSIEKCQRLKKEIETEQDIVEQSSRPLPDKKAMVIARIVHKIIRYFIQDTIQNSKKNIDKTSQQIIEMNNVKRIVKLSSQAEEVNAYLEKIVQKKVICNSEVARADYNAQMVIKALFEKYYTNPRLLRKETINKIFIDMLAHKSERVSNSAVNLNDCSVRIANREIYEMSIAPFEDMETLMENRNRGCVLTQEDVRFQKRRILVRNIVDYIADMTDTYAMQEYENLK